MIIEEHAGHGGADDAGDLLQQEPSSTTCRRARVRPSASSATSTNTTVECPRENQNPTDTGRLPSAISLRVVLSIAAMWSASKACRMPRV